MAEKKKSVDDAIEEVAGRLASRCRAVRFAVHLSGLKPVIFQFGNHFTDMA